MGTFDDAVFWHTCVHVGCTNQVEFDDEPWCFAHSPDEGSSLRGYSARRAAEEISGKAAVRHENVFDREGVTDAEEDEG